MIRVLSSSNAATISICSCHHQSQLRIRGSKEVPGVPSDSVLARDIQLFANFSDQWLAWHPQQAQVLGDLRYALRPDAIEPLWGISVNPQQPDQHVDFMTFRHTRRDTWQVLWQMIRHGNVSH